MTRNRPFVLALLDGWGVRAERENNALALARTPIFDRLAATGARTLLNAAGEAVGLAPGAAGHAQIGHMTIAAGRTVSLPGAQVQAALSASNTAPIANNAIFKALVHRLRSVGGAIHLVGLVSPAGIHGHQHYMAVLAALLSHENIQVWIHALMDGEDTPPRSGLTHFAEFLDDIAGATHVNIATVSGRSFAMSRTGDWAAIERTYRAIADAEGPRIEHGPSYVNDGYRDGLTDAGLPPAILPRYRGIRQDDALLFVNLRPDQIHRLAESLLTPDFQTFARPQSLGLSAACSLTPLAGDLGQEISALFPAPSPSPTLSESIAAAGLSQLQIAETANEAHLALFHRAGRTQTLPGEEVWLAETPVAALDKRPDMATLDAAAYAVKAIKKASHDVIVINFSNAAYAGHTGNLAAARKAAESVDKCLGKLTAMIEKQRGTLLVAGVYGNAERMADETGAAWPANTAAHTPLLLIDTAKNSPPQTLRPGTLADLAPTMLNLLRLPIPALMTGGSLLVPLDQDARASA